MRKYRLYGLLLIHLHYFVILKDLKLLMLLLRSPNIEYMNPCREQQRSCLLEILAQKLGVHPRAPESSQHPLDGRRSGERGSLQCTPGAAHVLEDSKRRKGLWGQGLISATASKELLLSNSRS